MKNIICIIALSLLYHIQAISQDKRKAPDFRAKITKVDNDKNFALIDRGTADKLKPGLKGELFRGKKKLGKIQIRKCHKEFSVIDLDLDKGEKVIEGDIATINLK